MLDRLFGKNTHTYVLIFGLCSIAIGLTFSKAILSLGLVLLALNFFLEWNFQKFWIGLKSNRVFHLIFAFFLIHAISLLWSSNLAYGLDDLKGKIPLLVIPFIVAAQSFSKRSYLHIILLSFFGAVFVTSILNFAFYQHWIGNRVYDNFRGMSLFTSHIRFSLFIAFCVVIAIYFSTKYRKWIPILLPIAAWFIFYSLYSQVLSGIFALALSLFILVLIQCYRKKKLLAYGVASLAVIPTAWLIIWLFTPLSFNPSEYQNLDKLTAEGRPYVHSFDYISSERQTPILLYICEEELRREWNNHSSFDYQTGLDLSGNELKYNLICYLDSKDLRKDAQGVLSLTVKDIENIEAGHSSVNHEGIIARLHSLRQELNRTKDPNGSSILQRVEYWSAGASILSNNWILGVGVGDVEDAFNSHYQNTNSPLHEEHRRRAHNMFLTVWISFGLLGFALFVFMIVRFLKHVLAEQLLLGALFMCIALASFVFEDTLETQTGVTFFALFFAVFQLRYTDQEMTKKESLAQ